MIKQAGILLDEAADAATVIYAETDVHHMSSTERNYK